MKCVRNSHMTGQWCQMVSGILPSYLRFIITEEKRTNKKHTPHTHTHYLFVFYKIVNVCLMVWSIECMVVVTNFGSVFHHFMSFCFFFRDIGGCCQLPHTIQFSSVVAMAVRFSCFFIEKIYRMTSLTRSFGDVSHFANKLFNHQKKQYKSNFFHKYYREFGIHVSPQHGEDKNRSIQSEYINSMQYYTKLAKNYI